jgi:hypothetical protein
MGFSAPNLNREAGYRRPAPIMANLVVSGSEIEVESASIPVDWEDTMSSTAMKDFRGWQTQAAFNWEI